MSCAQCAGIEKIFTSSHARKELKRYHKKGPAKSTRRLIDVLRSLNLSGMTLLDIGGGIGAIQHALLPEVMESGIDVDASTAYLDVARQEAQKLGYASRCQYLHGDFVELAGEIPGADVVTLDRVICCYPDMHKLMELSADRCRRFLGLVLPRQNWFTRGVMATLINTFTLVTGNPFRFYVHPVAALDSLLLGRGFRLFHDQTSGVWQIRVYQK